MLDSEYDRFERRDLDFDLDAEEYDLFWPFEEDLTSEEDEEYMDLYDQMSYIMDHGE